MAAGLQRFFVLRCSPLDIQGRVPGPTDLHLIYGKNSCNPHVIQWCLLEERSRVRVFLQDIKAKLFLGFGDLEAVSLSPADTASNPSRPPTITKERFELPITFRIQLLSNAALPFSQTETLINRLHPPSGTKSLSQATMGQEVDPICATEAIRLFEQAALKSVTEQKPSQSKDSPAAFRFSSACTDAPTVLHALLKASGDRFGQPLLLHASLLGSRRYGVSLEDSDVDLFVVLLLGFRRFCSIIDPPFQILQNGEHTRPDYTLIEAQSYCRMLIQGDPRTVESLFVCDPLRPNSELLSWLIKHRTDFLTVHLVKKMLKDATSQRKMQALVSFDDRTTFLVGSLPTGSRRQKLWYLILRLLLHATEIITEKTMSIPMPEHMSSELLKLRRADACEFAAGEAGERSAAIRCFQLIDSLEISLAATPPLLPRVVPKATLKLVESELVRWRMWEFDV